VFKEGAKTADMGVKPQKAMVVAKTRRAWDKAVDKLCASGVQLCKTQVT
jgi:hypothetical protein